LPYWWEYLPERQTLFIQYNQCADQPGHPFGDFVREVFAFSDSNSVRRLVVDLRGNSGGNSEVINPLLHGLQARPSLNAKGRLFVLIGPATFSSGEMAAEAFSNHYQSWAGVPFQATLVGRPTGGKPNCYGEIKSLTLPNSKLQIYYSIKHFQTQPHADPPSLEPDITVPTTMDDLLSGRDPVLERVLSLGPG
jgi:C-terminal processing protease CtpA/Prc